MPINSVFIDNSIVNPVIFSDWDSDLEGGSLFAAKRRMEERWESSSLVNLGNLFDAKKSIFVDPLDVLTPIVADELQKAEFNSKTTTLERADIYAKTIIDPRFSHTMIYENADIPALASYLGLEQTPELLAGIRKRLGENGLKYSDDDLHIAIATRYLKDSHALHAIEGTYSGVGKFFTGAALWVADQLSDPLNLTLDIAALGSGAALGGLFGAGVSKAAAVILGESVGLASKQTALHGLITNSRRENLGLEKLPLGKTFAIDVLAGAAIGTAMPLIFAGGAKLLKTAKTAFAKTPFERVHATAQDAQGRFKPDLASDSALANEAAIASKEGFSYAKSSIPKVVFPRVSDPSVPTTNRAIINSLDALTDGLGLDTELDSFFQERLVNHVSSFNTKDLFLFTETIAKAKSSQTAKNEFIKAIRQSSTKDELLKAFSGILFDAENGTIKNYISETRPHLSALSAEDARNSMGFEALKSAYSAVFGDVVRTEEELLNLPVDTTSGNPWFFAETEAELRNSARWERLRSQASDVSDGSKSFSTSTWLQSKITELSDYSAILSGLRAEFMNSVTPLLRKVSTQDLIDAFLGLSNGASQIRETLASIKSRRREIAKQYGIEYGEIEDHIPQAWRAEAVLSAGFDQFFADFSPALDIEATSNAYNRRRQERLFLAERKLTAEINAFDKESQRRVNALTRTINAAEKSRSLFSDRAGKLRLKLISDAEKRGDYALRQLARFEGTLTKEKALFGIKQDLTQAKIDRLKISGEKKLLLSRFKKYDAQVKNLVASEKALIGEFSKKKDALVTYNELRKALKLNKIFSQRGVASEILEKSDAWRIEQKATRKNEIVAYNFLKSLKLVPERENNKAFLSISDLRNAFDALENIPARLSDAKRKVVDSIIETNKLRRANAELKRVGVELEDEGNLASKIYEIEQLYADKLKNVLSKNAARYGGKFGSLTSKQQKSLLKRAEAASKLTDISELLSFTDEYGVFLTEDAKRESAAIRADYKSKLAEAFESIEKKETVAGLEKYQKKLDAYTEAQLRKFEKFAEKTDTAASRAVEKLKAKREKIASRDISARVSRAFESVEKLKKEIGKPFGRAEMLQLFDNITTDDILDVSTSVAKPTMSTKHRVLYFKDAAAFEKLNRKYGKTPDIRLLIARDLETNMRDIARLRAFRGSEEFYSKAFESDFNFLKGDADASFAERSLKSIVESNIKYVAGKSGVKPSPIRAMGQLYASLIRMSALGGAGLTTLIDDAQSVAFASSQNGLSFMRTIGHYLSGIANFGIKPEEASRLLVALDDISSGFEDQLYVSEMESLSGKISDIAKKVDSFTFKMNGVSHLSDSGRVVFNRFFLKELGSLRSETNSKFREMLANYGISERDIDSINALSLDDEGVPIFDSEFKQQKLYSKVLRVVFTENRKAVSQTSQSLKAVMATEGAGGFTLGIINSLFFLKRIPMQIWFDRALMPIFQGKFGDAAKFFAQNLIATSIRLTLKYLAMGYAPNFSDPNFYREVIMQSPSIPPVLQPFLSLDKMDRFKVEHAVGRSFLGAYAPLIDVAQLITDGITGESETAKAKDQLRVLRDFAPLKTHPALAKLYDRYVFDNFILMSDPEALKTLAGVQDRMRKSGKIKVF